MVTCIFLRAYHSGHCYNRDKNAFNKVIKQLIRRTTIGRLGWKCMWSAARALCYLLVRMPVTCATARGRARALQLMTPQFKNASSQSNSEATLTPGTPPWRLGKVVSDFGLVKAQPRYCSVDSCSFQCTFIRLSGDEIDFISEDRKF